MGFSLLAKGRFEAFHNYPNQGIAANGGVLFVV
jgi:hypothetical protein